MKDLAEGKYKLPWDQDIKIRDGWEYYPDGVKLGPMPTAEPAKEFAGSSVD